MKGLDDLFTDLFNADDQIAESAALSLPKYGLPALERLSQSLEDTHPDHRWWVVRALAEFNLPAVPPLLIAALADPDPDVISCSLLAMRNRPDPSFIPHLTPLLSSPIDGLPRLAADALIAIGPPAAGQLIHLVDEAESEPPSEAVRALAQIGEYTAVPSLFRLLDSGNPLIEYWAQQGLENLSIGMTFFLPD